MPFWIQQKWFNELYNFIYRLIVGYASKDRAERVIFAQEFFNEPVESFVLCCGHNAAYKSGLSCKASGGGPENS